ncbi:hypothetical protein DFS34DRAFT_598193 [Phlyctochytrium arcticum]|nr:hypothetical protein DFS34DRAFT_598193 [Phlyctochytrium arcticum]
MLFESVSGLKCGDIRICDSSATLARYAWMQTPIVVLKPGSYSIEMPLVNPITIVGLGTTIIKGNNNHAAHVMASKTVTFRNITFTTTHPPATSAVCADEGSHPRLVNCGIPRLLEVGLLIHGGSAEVVGCHFTQTGKQAIEVRQGGSLDIRNSVIDRCFQGVCAYGGAKRNTCRGSRKNAATRAQEVLSKQKVSTTTQEAQFWGDKNQIDLEVTVIGSTISASQIIYLKKEGLHVGVNYGGNVVVTGNSFVGRSEKAVVEEMFDQTAIKNQGQVKLLGYWSKPVVEVDSQRFADVKNLPTLAELASRFPLEGTLRPQQASTMSSMVDLQLTHRNVTSEYDPYYYAIGNTFGEDLSIGVDFSKLLKDECGKDRTSIRILLAACGDIRNLLKTSESLLKKEQQLELRFVLNDVSISILARDILLLQLIANGCADADIVAVWANHELTEGQRDLIDQACKTFCEDCFSAYASCTVPMNKLRKLRSGREILREKSMRLSLDALGESSSAVQKEVKDYITTGNLLSLATNGKVNPTLFEAPLMRYDLYWSSSIFRAVKLDEPARKGESLYYRLLRTLGVQFAALREGLNNGHVEVNILPGDIISALLAGIPEFEHAKGGAVAHAKAFDLVDCSNVMDYVSLPAILLGLKCVMTNPNGCIHSQGMQIMRDNESKDPSAVVRMAVGLSVDVFEQSAGLYLLDTSISNHLSMKWKPFDDKSERWLTPAYLLADLIIHHRNFSGLRDDTEASSPILLVQLLSRVFPNDLVKVVDALIQWGQGFKLNRCELKLKRHAIIQQNHIMGTPLADCVIASVKLEVHFYSLQLCGIAPLALVFSKNAIRSADTDERGEFPSDSIIQVIESFTFSRETGMIEFLASKKLLQTPVAKTYYLTLCAVAQGRKQYVSVSTSIKVSELKFKDVDGVGLTWKLPVLGSHTLSAGRLLDAPTGWETLTVHKTDSFVCCDVKFPVAPLPDDLSVSVRGKDGNPSSIIEVSLGRKKGGKAGGDNDVFPAHSIDLGEKCRIGKECIVKICRQGGFLAIKAPKCKD